MPSEETSTTVRPTELRTDRLRLRPCSLGDAAALFAIYAHDEVAFFMLPGPASRGMIEKGLANAKPWNLRPRWAIICDGAVIGEIVLEIDAHDATANLGYVIGREHWGKGLATEAACVMVDYGFRDCGLAKICARADPRNVGSIRVMEKIGMRKEAHLRSQVVRRGERCDRVWYGILRHEWESEAPPSRRT